jgi:hypothetical protein
MNAALIGMSGSDVYARTRRQFGASGHRQLRAGLAGGDGVTRQVKPPCNASAGFGQVGCRDAAMPRCREVVQTLCTSLERPEAGRLTPPPGRGSGRPLTFGPDPSTPVGWREVPDRSGPPKIDNTGVARGCCGDRPARSTRPERPPAACDACRGRRRSRLLRLRRGAPGLWDGRTDGGSGWVGGCAPDQPSPSDPGQAEQTPAAARSPRGRGRWVTG